jgi:hypothetical protein
MLAAASCGGSSGGEATSTNATTTTTTIPTTTTTTDAATTTTADPPGCSTRELDYFAQVAGGIEFGPHGTIHKWQSDLRIQIYGDPDPASLAALSDVIADLDEVVDPIGLSLVDSGGNVDLHFAPVSQFPAILLEYEPENFGFLYVWWDAAGVIDRATVLISTTDIDQAARTHLIREELTQSLGLLNDSWDDLESIFYQGWTTVQEYTPLDLTVIAMLYEPGVTAGMPIADALAAVTCAA